MKRILYTLTIGSITLGVIALALNTVFGYGTVTYLTRIRIYDTWMWKYDFWNYVENIRNSFTNVSELSLSMPDREWETLQATNFGSALGNNLAMILDYIIIGLNVLFYPLRIIFYAIQILLSLIGLPTVTGTYGSNPMKWLIDLCKFFVTLQIPYV